MISETLAAEIQENKAVNRLHTILLILAMLALLSMVGYLTFGRLGVVLSIIGTLVSVLLGPRVSTAWIMRMYHGQQVTPNQAPELVTTFHELVRRAGLEHVPKLYYIPSRMPNAFATGTNRNAAIAVTDGILRMMTSRELTGILAHEVSHLMHRDTTVMALADTMSRITSSASRLGFILMLLTGFLALLTQGVSGYFVLAFAILFFSPTLMVLLQLALSRSREFNADLGAVQLTGDANGLASALRKLERLNYHGSFWQRILQPGSHRAQPAFLRTHPPTEERVRRLLEHIEDSAGGPGITYVDRPRRLAVNQPRVRARPRYHVSNGLWY